MSKRTVELELATTGVDAQGAAGARAARRRRGHARSRTSAASTCSSTSARSTRPRTACCGWWSSWTARRWCGCIPHVGYLHSGFEKLGEYRHYNQIIPLTDRTDYLSPMANNVALALAAEQLMGIEITPRCTVLRVIACEMSRIISHLVWLGTTAIDIGAFTPFLWAFQERERIYNLQEMWTGARLTTSLTRVGGMMADIPDGFVDGLRALHRDLSQDARRDRPRAHPQRDLGGPHAGHRRDDGRRRRSTTRSPGRCCAPPACPTTCARTSPYLDYETYDFDVPVGRARRRVRPLPRAAGGVRQSNRILEQALDRLPDGPINVDDPRVILPPKSRAMSDMEAMIYPLQAGDGRRQGAGRRGVRGRSRTPRASWATTSCPTARRSRCAGASGRPRSSTSRASRRWPRDTCCRT